MPKGYWIVNNDITDPAAYEGYKAANAAPLQRYRGKFLVRAGTQQASEGDGHPRSVIIEFPSYADAVACYDDTEYQAAVRIRQSAAQGLFVIVEGYDP